MSDFLTRASEVALGVRPVVQPLVAARYAPGPRQPVLEMETMVEQSASVGVESAAKSSEAADLNNASELAAESLTRAADRAARSAMGVIDTVSTPPAQPAGRPDGISAAMPDGEHSAQSTIEQKEVTVATLSVDRLPANTGVSFRPEVVTVSESAGAPQSHLPPPAVAPLSVRSMNIEAAVTQTAVRESEHSAPQASLSRPHVEHPNANEFRAAGIASGSSVADREAVGDVDPSPRHFSDDAGFTNRDNEIGRAAPDRDLDSLKQPLLSLRDEWNSLDQSPGRSAARRDSSRLSSAPDRGGAEPAPPIVRVTIGRVEVRAAAPPAAPSETPALPPPKMSLDEYLRQHNGRRR